MKKIFFIFVAITITLCYVYPQQLTINETLSYINQSLGGITSSSNSRYVYRITLSSNGDFVYYEDYVEDANYNESYSAHISDLVLENFYDGEYPFIFIRCKEGRSGCIRWKGTKVVMPSCLTCKDGGVYHNRQSNESSFSLYSKESSEYSTQKLHNALTYLFALAKEKGMFDRGDSDPFAPQNFNPSSMEIKSSSSSGSIKLSRQGGVFYIPVVIGGITKDFILDSGASDVMISQSFERELIDKGFLRREDYISPALYKIADGSIVESRRLIIPQLSIGNFTITNVQASVGIGSVPLLLGKSVLDKFRNWSIDNQTQTLVLSK